MLILFWDHSVSILCMCTGLKQVKADIQMWMCLACPVLVHHTKPKYWFLPQNHNYGGGGVASLEECYKIMGQDLSLFSAAKFLEVVGSFECQ